MGVPETLKRLGPLMKEANLWQEARGRVVGFDGHVFLHHFVYAAAADIINHGDYKPLAKMFRQRCQQIVGHGVNPIIVFDGMPNRLRRNAKPLASRYDPWCYTVRKSC